MTQKDITQKIKLTNEQMKEKMIKRAGSRIYLELGAGVGDTVTATKLARLILNDIEEELVRQNKSVVDKEPS